MLPLTITLTAQIALGTLNVILLAPVLLQMTHLLVAEMFWIVLMLASADQLFANCHAGIPLSPKGSTGVYWSLGFKGAEYISHDRGQTL